MASAFTHLHLHSQYSLLDGAIRLKDLFPRILQYGMNKVALTDHGNMFGALDFYKQARKVGIKPIFGCETYITADMTSRSGYRDSHHLVLLAKNLEGYHNLAYLVSKAWLEGFYYSPRIDKKLLRERRAGLIGMTACLSGEVPSTVLRRGTDQAQEVALEYADIFEPNSFFLELQPNGMKDQEEVNAALIKIAANTGIGLVATNDCHYLDRKDAKAHDVLMCVQTGKTVDDENRIKHEVDEFYLKSPEEMEEAFAHVPEALENAAAIGELCNVELDLEQTLLPDYKVPEGFDLVSYLTKLSQDGLERRFAEMRQKGLSYDEPVYQARLKRELDVIMEMKFPGYFLIVWDFINFAKSQGIPVGPGRGSGAGSLVAYSLRITDLDPIPYNLLFERFLNPERVSMPDFDIDFCMNRRDEVIHYVSEKYGRNNVGQIATYHSLKAKGVVRDVARAMGLTYADGDKVAKLIPEPQGGKSVSIPEALKMEPRLQELADAEPKIATLLEVASSLEGLNRHAGMHAAGVVIAEEPLWDLTPCFKGQNDEIVTQYAKNEVEDIGLVKFDFLGLKTLTILDTAVRLILQRHPDFDLNALGTVDEATYKMIAAGQTTGVFQLESPPFKEVLKQLKPDCFEDIVAAVALYRPGPLGGGMVDDFIKGKHGLKKVTYPHPWLEDILEETYGVIVYQEQVMQIASILAGFSLGQADILRRAMGKKKESEMAKQKKVFLEGAAKKDVDARVAGQVFDLMAFFAGYGFNKSHSASYALITFQTAYLKCHFPVEFMAAVLTCERENADNLVKYTAETRAMGIRVVRPDVNESDAEFSVLEADGEKYIRFGLTAVRNVGEGAVEAIVEARQQAPFTGLFDCCERVDTRRVNKRVIEALIKSGAFDDVSAPRGISRARLMAALDAAQERAMSIQRDRASGQTSLLGLLDSGGPVHTPAEEDAEKYPDVPLWEPRVMLSFEKENLGFYVSGHPLERYAGDLRRHATATIGDIKTASKRREVSIGGLVTGFRERPLRSGKGRMATFSLEDDGGSVEVVVYSKPFAEFEQVLKADEPLLITAKLELDGEGDRRTAKLYLRAAETLAALRQRKTHEMRLRINADELQPSQLVSLKGLLLEYPGDCRVMVDISIPQRSCTHLSFPEQYSVNPSDELLFKLERLLGDRAAVLR